jgi:predicted lipoprotein with Yx(FWY)xxD motif
MRLVLLAVLAALVAACGQTGGHVIGIGANSAPTTGPNGPGYMVQLGKVKGLGTVLVDGYGLTLYLFVPDQQSGHSTCDGYCATEWPPATLPAGVTTPVIGSGVDKTLVGTTRRGNVLQLTYNGWPLYRWIGDTSAGEATGQGIVNAGGLWYVVDDAGQAVH